MANGKVTIPISLLAIIIVIALASLGWAFTTSGRVSVLESEFKNISTQLNRIEAKIDKHMETHR